MAFRFTTVDGRFVSSRHIPFYLLSAFFSLEVAQSEEEEPLFLEVSRAFTKLTSGIGQSPEVEFRFRESTCDDVSEFRVGVDLTRRVYKVTRNSCTVDDLGSRYTSRISYP